MKRTIFFSIALIMLLSAFNIGYGATNNKVKAKFTVNDVSGTNFKEITITPYDSSITYNDEDNENTEEKSYKIYLPTGYMVEGTSASYVADRNGKYPFTVYDGSYKKTFIHNVDDIDEPEKDDDKKSNIFFDYKLMYDYEKKQIFFNMNLDKIRNVKTPNNNSNATNEVNYYIEKLANNIPHDFTITIDDESFSYKVIKSGEFYLLIYISPVNYNDYSTIVEYFGYNFTNNANYKVLPDKDIYDDNGTYEILVKSNNSQHVFIFNIDGIDYRRPFMDIDIADDNIFDLEIKDDFKLDYIITYDGQYKKISSNSENTYKYRHSTEIIYNGEYIFTAVDEKGNRTVETIVVKSKKRPRPHAIGTDVHDFKYTEDLFENIGLEYEKSDDKSRTFENILPAYMNGKSPNNFNPDSPISRAEMVTIFCRLNDLPYDTSAYLKSKFTDIDKHWARDYISMGSSKKYVSGYKDNTFKPDSNVTRAEFCQMLTKISAYKALLNAIPASTNVDYPDISDHWAEKEIIKIAGRNLVTTTTDEFYPDKAITRGEVVHAINMLYGFNPSYLELAFINSFYNKYYSFQDINTHKYYSDIIISLVGMYREKIN